jgi:predicted lipoprotein
MKCLLTWLIGIATLAGLAWFFPLFHVVPLERATKDKAAATFNPTEFAETFWNDRLMRSLDKAVKLDVLLPAIQRNPAEARKNFSRSIGVSDSYSYFVSGLGRVVSVTDDEIGLVISTGATNAEVVLQSGLLFGNVVRDGTGLLNVNDFPNSQDFNAISEALNHIVEIHVEPKLRELAKVGALIRFVGCAEVNDESTDLKPLHIVPIQTDIP